MKKIISLILIAILCLGVLTSCAQLGGVVDSIKDKLGMGGEQPAEGPSLDEAASFLHKIYKDKKENTDKDFDVVSQVSINGIIFPVTWTSDNDKVVIRESTKTGFYTVDLPDVNNEEFSYTLTATISNADGETASKSYTFKVPVIDNSGITSTPVEGVAYKLFLLQGNENRRYYALNTTQNNENKFINTSLNPKDGAEFFVEKVDGGYKIFTDVNGVKTYMYAKVTRTEDANTGAVKYSKFIGFNTEEGSVFSYNEKKGGVWTVTVDELVYGVGTYGSYTTISLSDESFFTPDKVGSDQFVMQFMTAEYANTLEEDKLPESPSDAEGILNQLYALADGEQAIGSFTLTGKITALDNYNNPTIVVEGFENMPVYCYRLTVENKVGDTITVTATTMKNYGGTYEFMNCTLVSGGNQGGNEGGDGETSENAVLDLMGKANLVNGSAEQNVFAANGITFTNDKASSTSDLTVQDSYAQRAYAGSTVKIEYPGMTKIVLTLDDYSDGKYLKGFDGMTVEGATITRENDVVTITFTAATNVFQSTTLVSQVRIEKIEVFTGEVETPDTPVDPKPETPAYTAPVAGQAYDLYMELPTGKVYFAGSMSGDYLATTTDAAASVKIFFEEVTGGYHIYFMNGDVKTYITAAAYLKSNGYAGCHFSTTTDTPTLAWTYDTTYGIIEIYDEVEGKSDTFFAGTYGTYSTVSLSGAYYKDQIASGTQYPARLELAEGGNTPVDPNPDTPEHTHSFVEGKCECGAEDPNYVPEHTHSFVEGKCECGEEDPNYQPPAGDEGYNTITIPEALAIAKGQAHNTYTADKYYITGTVTNLYNTQYGNFYIKDAEGNEICVYGLYNEDGTVRYDAMNYKPVNGDVVTVYGVLGAYNTTYQMKNGWLVEVTAHEHNYVETVTAPTCIAEGYTTHKCSICDNSYVDSTVAALGHTTESGKCERCGLEIGGDAPTVGTLVTFDFGANGSAAHVDGNDYGTAKEFTAGTYTLSLTGMSKVYGPAYDAQGNSCIKLGTSSKTGSFSFTVGENVTEVVIYVAQYKANTTKINVNGVDYTITTASNNGEYTAITIDTTTNKTIEFATVSGGVRCMIDKIVFNGVVG